MRKRDRFKSLEQSCTRPLVIWNGVGDYPKTSDRVYYWNGQGQLDTGGSILSYIEENADRLRSKYLAWVYELSQTEVANRRLESWLDLDNDMSYWWMTLVAEKSIWKTSSVVDSLRLLALEEIISEADPSEVVLYSGDRRIYRVVKGLCEELDVRLVWRRGDRASRSISPRDRFRRLVPTPLLGLRALVLMLHSCWLLRSIPQREWFGNQDSVFFCSYFANLIPVNGNWDRFQSNYWGSLNKKLREAELESNWLHLFVPHLASSDAKVASPRLERYNDRPKENGTHNFVLSFFSGYLALRVVSQYLRLFAKYLRLLSGRRLGKAVELRAWIWPLVWDDWRRSMVGPEAFSSLFYVELFDAAMSKAPYQRKGYYLCENQGWERALIRAWRKYGHGELTAVPHSTVRFWDMRYFEDPRVFDKSREGHSPLPDLFALNGPRPVREFLQAKYPSNMIRECEALRFEHLMDVGSFTQRRTRRKESVRLLVLTDYDPEVTHRMMGLLESVSCGFPAGSTIAIKCHFDCLVGPASYPGLSFHLLDEPIGAVVRDFDVVLSSSRTSASLDAVFQGVPVVVLREEAIFDMCPLRGTRGVRFVDSRDQLLEALVEPGDANNVHVRREEFFFLDPELPRWTSLIGD